MTSTDVDSLPPSVLFVCTANQVRSPIAAALFKRILKDKISDWKKWKTGSAGTWGESDRPAIPEAAEVMNHWGMDLSRHRSTIVTRDLVKQYRLVLVMEPNHKEALQVEFPEWKERIYLLSEMVDEVKPIRDPMGDPAEAFEKTALEINNFLEKGLPRINRLARE